MGRAVRRRVWIGAATGVVALLGIPAGLLWTVVAPRTTFVVAAGNVVVADPETQSLIAADGWFALIGGVAGLACGVVAYALAGRLGEIGLLVAVAVGGTVAAVLAWRVGHVFGLSAYEHVAHAGREGSTARGALDLRAVGVLIVWPLLAVIVFGLLEALDVASRNLDAGDHGGAGAGQADQVGGGQFDFEATPTGGDVDRRET